MLNTLFIKGQTTQITINLRYLPLVADIFGYICFIFFECMSRYCSPNDTGFWRLLLILIFESLEKSVNNILVVNNFLYTTYNINKHF